MIESRYQIKLRIAIEMWTAVAVTSLALALQQNSFSSLTGGLLVFLASHTATGILGTFVSSRQTIGPPLIWRGVGSIILPMIVTYTVGCFTFDQINHPVFPKALTCVIIALIIDTALRTTFSLRDIFGK